MRHPKRNSEISLERLKEIISYDPETGLFTWLVKRGSRAMPGYSAGKKTKNGYWTISIDYQSVKAHRLAWFYMTGEWPDLDIDHINGCGTDNRWANLRLATCSQNSANTRTPKNNKSGHKGVSWHAPSARWRAAIWRGGRQYHIGFHATVDLAAAAYEKKAAELFGEFARHT
jgi:hypothetical protein